MTFEDELKALRLLHTQLRPFPREHRDRLIRQVQDALNREDAAKPRLLRHPLSVVHERGLPPTQYPVEHIAIDDTPLPPSAA